MYSCDSESVHLDIHETFDWYFCEGPQQYSWLSSPEPHIPAYTVLDFDFAGLCCDVDPTRKFPDFPDLQDQVNAYDYSSRDLDEDEERGQSASELKLYPRKD